MSCQGVKRQGEKTVNCLVRERRLFEKAARGSIPIHSGKSRRTVTNQCVPGVEGRDEWVDTEGIQGGQTILYDTTMGHMPYTCHRTYTERE